MSSSNAKIDAINPARKYESTIALIRVMSLLFFIIIGVFSFGIQPQVYSVLSCNAGTTPFCEMDPLVQTADTSADSPHITYSNILSTTHNITTQTISFPYYKTTGGTITSIYMIFTFVASASLGTAGTPIYNSDAGTTKLFNIDTSLAGTSAEPITVESAIVANPEQIMAAIIYVLHTKSVSKYVMLEFYQNSKSQIIYALTNDGSGSPTITVTGGTGFTQSDSILGFESLIMNRDSFQTHNSTVENANDGYLDIVNQQKAIAKYPKIQIAGCGEPSAVSSLLSINFIFHPEHGLYYPATLAPPAAPTPCVYKKSAHIYQAGETPLTNPDINCGYRFIDHTDRTNVKSITGYQLNHIYYNGKNNNAASNNVGTYYDGFTNPNGRKTLKSKYPTAAQAAALQHPQLQENLVCAGFDPKGSTAKDGYKRNNFDNVTAAGTATEPTAGPVTDNSVNAVPYEFSTYPNVSRVTSPIPLGFS